MADNKRVGRDKMEILRLQYKDETVFPYKKYVTKLKKNFRVLEKDDNKRMTGSQRQVHDTTDVGIEAGKMTVFHSMQNSFDKAVEFMSAYISNRHAGAQADYANQHGAGGGGRGRRYVSTTGSETTHVVVVDDLAVAARAREATVAVLDAATHAARTPLTSISRIPIAISRRLLSGRNLEQYVTMSCNCKRAAAVVQSLNHEQYCESHD